MADQTSTNWLSHPPTSLHLAIVVLLAGTAGIAIPNGAQAGGTSVRYSYEQVDVAGQSQWALVPKPADKLRGEITTNTLNKAFKILKEEKSTSYGDTSIQVDGRSVENARVTVYIDAEHSQYKLIIMAEAVYTLTGLGVDGVRFPNFAEGVVDRSDIPFTAFTVTLPLWRAVPPNNLVDARVRLPSGDIVGLDEFNRRWKRGDSELQNALFEYLTSGQEYTVKSVLDRLPNLDVSYVDEVVPLLKADSEAVRKKALKTLANERNQKEVLEAVVGMMRNDDSDELARKAAEFLGKADDKKYQAYEQFFLLRRGSKKERLNAAKELASYSGDSRARERLAAALRNTKKKYRKVAKRAAKSLLKLDAYDVLAEALGDGDVPSTVEMTIARGLTEESDQGAKIDGYRYLAAHATGREARVAVRSLYEDVGTTKARKVVEGFLTDDTRGVRRAAAQTLEKFDSLESLSAMADAIRDGKSASVIEDAGFAILKEEGVRKILEFTRSNDTILKRIAYRALGPKAKAGIAKKPVMKRLKRGADSSDPKIRGAAARGLGLLGNDEALKVLKKLADDSSAVVRRGVAHALSNYDSGEMTDTLTEYLNDSEPKVVAAALSSLTERREAKNWEKMEKLADADAPIVRRRAVEALATLVSKDDDKAVKQVISQLSGIITSADNKRVVRTTVRQLGRFNRERAVGSIALKLSAQTRKTKLAAIRALGATGHKKAVKVLTDKLNADESEIRRAAVKALGKLGYSQARSSLRDRLESEGNQEIKKLIQKTIRSL